MEQKFKRDLRERILTLNKTIWENKVSDSKISDWLDNFSDEEKTMALYLLSEFMYFGDIQLRVLLKTLYRDLFRYPIIKKIREDNDNTLVSNIIEELFLDSLKKTRFMGVGNPSESGAHLLYFFRQENKLPKEIFINSYEINDKKNETVNKLVFLDDFCGSGSQIQTDTVLTEFIEELKTKKPEIEIDYLMLVGTTNGIDNVNKSGMFNNVNAIIKLDDSFKCFESESRYFKNLELPFNLDSAKQFAYKYGLELMKDLCAKNGISASNIDSCAKNNALGYKDCQLLLGFNHNTPDNTLPIIWYDEEGGNSWRPIFKRYNKIYNFK